MGIGDIQVNWAKFSKQNLIDRAETLLHEAMHVILKKNVWKFWVKERYVYQAEFAALSTAERMNHADTYSEFAAEAMK